MFLNNKWIKEKIKQEIKNYLEPNENETQPYKIYVMQQTQESQEAGKISTKLSKILFKGTRKRGKSKTRSKQNEGNNKIGVESNEIKKFKKILMKLRADYLKV